MNDRDGEHGSCSGTRPWQADGVRAVPLTGFSSHANSGAPGEVATSSYHTAVRVHPEGPVPQVSRAGRHGWK